MEFINLSIPAIIWSVLAVVMALAIARVGFVAGKRSSGGQDTANTVIPGPQAAESVDVRLTEARLRTILNAEPECVKTVDCDKRLLYMNPAGLEMVAAENMKSVHLATVSDLVLPGERHIFESAHTAAFRGERCQVQYEIERLDGKRLYLDQISAPIFDPDEPGKVVEMLAVTRDITEQREATRQLIRARDDAEAANKAKSRFIATMSHELRTPLNGVLGMAQILSTTSLDKDQSDMLGTLSRAGENLLHVISDVLDFSRIEAGRMVLDNGGIDLSSVQENLAAVHEVIARQNGIALVFEGFDEGVTCRVGDEKRLTQILHNIVGNAVKFTDKGEVRVAVETQSDPAEADQITFTVNDTGIGIRQDQIDALFQPFTQIDDSSTRRHGGTGLGLAIARGLAQAMGGQISLARRPAGGTSVSITLKLPRQIAVGHEASVDQVLPKPASVERLKGKRVLVVEDNADNQRTMTGMLQLLGVTPTLAENGGEAVQMANATLFDAIIMDIHMPVMDGVRALDHIRQGETHRGTPPVPAIACTADVRPTHLVELRRRGFVGVVEKPYGMKYLQQVLTDALAGEASGAEQGRDNAQPSQASG